MGYGPRYKAEDAIPLAAAMLEALGGPGEATVCGSLRRRRALVGDIDLVPHRLSAEEACALLRPLGWSVVEAGHPRTVLGHSDSPIQADLWCDGSGDPNRTAGARVLHATGSGVHNTLMRRWARERHGLSVTWMGAHRISDWTRMDDGSEHGIRDLIGWPRLLPWDRDVDPLDLPPWLFRLLAELDTSGEADGE